MDDLDYIEGQADLLAVEAGRLIRRLDEKDRKEARKQLERQKKYERKAEGEKIKAERGKRAADLLYQQTYSGLCPKCRDMVRKNKRYK